MFQSFLKKNLIQSAEFNLQLVSDNISTDLNELTYFVTWCCTNNQILAYLQNSDDDKPAALNAWNTLNTQYMNSRISSYIKRLVISKNNNDYLQLISSTGDASRRASVTISQADFFEPLYSYNGFLWSGTVQDPLEVHENQQIIPVVRPIYGRYNSEVVGWTYFAVSTNLITDYLKNYGLPNDSALFISIGNKTYQVTENQLIELTEEFHTKKVLDGLTLNPETQTKVITDKEGKEQIVVTRTCAVNGWSVSQIISKTQLSSQKQVYFLMLLCICLLVVALGMTLTYYINRAVNQPIDGIRRKMAAISKGDFTPEPAIEWEHELGEVGKGINILSKDILNLMEKRVEDEKKKKDLEYQMLQSQINPHFLYNTLNSIKWMATIQNATGIAEMTTSLSRFLKNVAKGNEQLVTLHDELNLLTDYFVIQQYRYGGAISMDYEIASKDLYDCKIPRFTLQPIVENALFHGIESKGTTGHIQINIQKEKDDISIAIIDDGIGMSEELIQKILSGETNSGSEVFKKVGISNVHRRIQYEFGENYGITITSELHNFTKMTITIPYRKGST